ncbi:hypothetical protein ANCCEY_10835 [Ancylostoma ceylanicum]|uniref:Saposin A-type domain-containing protein n=1 Tax=Ancylostoma ceylanicum TaxID=53326 RepID=A0A0D6LDB3_9BILA|nr:hypothetical protein ANCCEY_10835 [Ancylostoma ceylanicum]
MLLILLIVGLPFISADRCSSVPPSLWCSSKELSKECGFEDLCDRYHTATHNQRINITVLIEALCPDCQRFIVDELYPNVYKNFAGFVNIEFVPYGNAKVVNGTIQCQHGPEECSINRFESCLIDSVQTQEQYVPLIYCIENNLRSKIPFDKASAKCFRTLSVSEDIQRLIQSCLVSRLGERLQEKAAKQTGNLNYSSIAQMLLILLLVGLSFVSADRCSSVPPSLWCSSKELSKECGFEDLCNRYHTATHNQRINITVLMEALCPGCQHFIVDELYPNIYKNFAGFVNIEFVPYGNAKIVNGTIQCQHGAEECAINRFESCLIDSVQTQEQYVPLIYCIESNLRVGFVLAKSAI